MDITLLSCSALNCILMGFFLDIQCEVKEVNSDMDSASVLHALT